LGRARQIKAHTALPGTVVTIELTITSKGQVTLRQALLDHLGLKPGDKVAVAMLRDGRVELAPAASGHDLRSLRGRLRRAGQQPVSLREMQEAIEAGRGR
jgi:AbrB family looped-hinge helix DNA binding protein